MQDYLGILHNSVKATENQPMYRECRFVEIGHQYTESSLDDIMLCTRAYLTLSYICTGKQLESLNVPVKIVEYIVQMLCIASVSEDSDGRHTFDGWHCGELAMGISNLSLYQPNIAKFMEKDPIPHFVKMLSFIEESDKENGLNGIASLVTPENRADIIKTDGLLSKLKSLTSHSKESIKQAAIWLLGRLIDDDDNGALAVDESANSTSSRG